MRSLQGRHKHMLEILTRITEGQGVEGDVEKLCGWLKL